MRSLLLLLREETVVAETAEVVTEVAETTVVAPTEEEITVAATLPMAGRHTAVLHTEVARTLTRIRVPAQPLPSPRSSRVVVAVLPHI